MDPVALGLCSQIDLDFEVNRAAKDRPAADEDRGQTLMPAEVTTGRAPQPLSETDVFGYPGSAAKPRTTSTSPASLAAARNRRSSNTVDEAGQLPGFVLSGASARLTPADSNGSSRGSLLLSSG